MAHTAHDPRFNDLVALAAPVRQIGTGFTFTEGPLWHPVDHSLLFSDMPGDVRRRWSSANGVEDVKRPSNKANGLTYDADLNLLICEHSTSSVVRLRVDGTREVLATHFEGRELNSPNDICVRSDGAIYFTDPTFGRMPWFGLEREPELGFQGVYRLPPNHRPGDPPQLVSDRYMFSQPNGLCLSPCEKFMWVNDTEQANIRMFDIAPDGSLTNARVFASGIVDASREGVPDGMKCDSDGNIYVTGPGGIWVYDFHGLKLGEIEIPEKPANLHWGGANWNTLFVCATTSVYAVEMKAKARQEPFMRSVSTASAARALTFEPKRTAMIIQDMQNDVIMDGGAFADSGSPAHARSQNVVANCAQIANLCRQQGVLVIHVWFVCQPGHPALKRNCGLYDGLISSNALVRGTHGVSPVPGLEPQTGDLIVEKMSMNAFETSRLESHLNHAGIDTIINTGAWTNMSVEHTARAAADKGFRVVLPENACSTMNADWHNASINYAMQNVADVTDTASVVAALSRGGPS